MKLEIPYGTHINNAINMALKKAREIGERVEFQFSDKEVFAEPDDIPDDVKNRWGGIVTPRMTQKEKERISELMDNTEIGPTNEEAFNHLKSLLGGKTDLSEEAESAIFDTAVNFVKNRDYKKEYELVVGPMLHHILESKSVLATIAWVGSMAVLLKLHPEVPYDPEDLLNQFTEAGLIITSMSAEEIIKGAKNGTIADQCKAVLALIIHDFEHKKPIPPLAIQVCKSIVLKSLIEKTDKTMTWDEIL